MSIVTAVTFITAAQAADEVAECRLGLASAVLRQIRAYQTNVDRCLKFAVYESCQASSDFFDQANVELARAVLDEDSPCTLALQNGASIAELAPPVCPGRAWYSDGSPAFGPLCSAPIEDLEDLRWCLRCQSSDLGARVLYDLDLPLEVPSSASDRKCIRAAHSTVARAVRTGMQMAIRCAAGSGDPPWDCPLDLSADSPFARNLAKFDKKIGKCRDASGVAGRIGRAASVLCNSAVATPSDLATCLRRTAICQACMAVNVGLARNDDCAAVSGDLDCGFDPNKPLAGSFVITNRDDDSISFFDSQGEPAGGTLAASTFATGPAPTATAVAEKTNTVMVINTGDASISTFHAGTGMPVTGDLETSTRAVGAAPVAILVNPERDIAYVANSGEGSVTFLDARDGSYVFGSLAASTFPVGQGPVALATDPGGTMLYVANSTDGTVTFLDASTGSPWFGLLGNSTFDAGPQPSAIVYRNGASGYPLHGGSHFSDAESIVVADGADGVIRSLDPYTGMPSAELYGETVTELGPAPAALVVDERNGDLMAVSAAVDQVLTWSSWRGFEPVVADARPTALALGGIGSTLGSSDLEDSSRPLIVTLGERDEAVVTSTRTKVANAGWSPAERSSVYVGDYRDWIYDAVTGRYFAAAYDSEYGTSDTVGIFDEDSLVLTQEIPSIAGTRRLAYSPSTDTIFAAARDSVAFLDATTGLPKFGDLASSTFQCGCSYIGDVVSSDVANRVYLLCTDRVAYLDASTGQCLGGGPETTGAQADQFRLHSIVVDEVGGGVLVSYAYCDYGAKNGAVYELDPVSPIYRYGTLSQSTLAGSTGRCGYKSLRVDGMGRLYAGGGDVYDIASGALVLEASIPNIFDFEVDPDTDVLLVRYGYRGILYYYRLSDLSYFGGDWSSSHLDLAYGPKYYVQRSFLVDGDSYWLLVEGGHATKIRRDQVGFSVDEWGLLGKTVPTGDFPAGVAAMPAHSSF